MRTAACLSTSVLVVTMCACAGEPTTTPAATIAPREPSPAVSSDAPAAIAGRNHDWMSTRVAFPEAHRVSPDAPLSGDFERDPIVGDFSYDVGGPVNGSMAIFNGGGQSHACTDRLFVPVNKSGAPNLVAFDNLHTRDANGVACVNVGGDAACSPSPDGHCPRKIWSTTLAGAMDGDSVSLSADGTRVYVGTTSGVLYAVGAADGVVAWSFDAKADTAKTDANFTLVTPWVDYPSGNVYVACSHTTDSLGRLYKISPSGTVLSSVALSAGVRSMPLVWSGFVYVAGRGGQVFKVQDGGSLVAISDGTWPITLQAAVPIVGSPSIDVVKNLLFVGVAEALWMVNLADGTKAQTSISAAAGQNAATSSPFVDLATSSVFIGHEGKIFRATYSASAWTATASAPVRGAGGVLDPKSSPMLATAAGVAYLFMGDAGGYLNRWVASDLSAAATFPSGATPLGGTIDSPVIMDYSSGNLYFGSANGRIYQIGQSGLQ